MRDIMKVKAVRKIKYTGKVYNIECAPRHTYIYNGCVVHNCGTGKRFIRNLTVAEIVEQVKIVFRDKCIYPERVEKLQIMFMSMGEPLLNWENVRDAIIILNHLYPNAQLLISTILPCKEHEISELIGLATRIDNIGLQFSLHSAFTDKRNVIIPFLNKYSIETMSQFGSRFFTETRRQVYLNICVDKDFNSRDVVEVYRRFTTRSFAITLSVICSPDETMKEAGYRDLDKINYYSRMFTELGYNTRVFDPEGQDDIGGGCGQLFHFQRLVNKNNEPRISIPEQKYHVSLGLSEGD